MEHRPLGRSGLRVSSVALGTVNFGITVDDAHAERMLAACLDVGVNLLDTADSYADGASEAILGGVLERMGRRDDVVIATKCGLEVGTDVNERGASRRHIRRSVERSLRRLRTDRIDLFQIHRAYLDTRPEETLLTLDALAREGKILAAGSSNFPAWYLMESLALSDRHGWIAYASEQPPYNLLDRRVENELIPLARRHGVAVLPWSPLAGGILAGRYAAPDEIPPDSRAARYYGLRERITPAALEVVAALAELAAAAGLTTTQLALVWLRDQPGVTSPIVGPRSLEQLVPLLEAAASASLPGDVAAAIDELVRPGSAVSDFHNASGWANGAWRHA